MKTYLELAREQGLSDGGVEILLALAKEAGMDNADDTLFDLHNYVLPFGKWDYQSCAGLTAANWAADSHSEYQIAALLALREAFDLPILV